MPFATLIALTSLAWAHDPPPSDDSTLCASWCVDAYENRLVGLAKEVDYVMCVDMVEGTPSCLRLELGAELRGEKVRKGWCRIQPRERGWRFEQGRDTAVIVRSDHAVSVTATAANELGVPALQLLDGGQATSAPDSEFERMEDAEARQHPIHVFHVAPFKSGASFKINVAASNSISRDIPIAVLPRYHGAYRLGLSAGHVFGGETWGTMTLGDDQILVRDDARFPGPEFVVGYAWYGPNGFVPDPGRYRFRLNPYLGFGLLRAGTSDIQNLRLQVLSSVYLGADVELGRSTSLVLAAVGSRDRVPRAPFGEGSVVTNDDVFRPVFRPGVAVILNVSPTFMKGVMK